MNFDKVLVLVNRLHKVSINFFVVLTVLFKRLLLLLCYQLLWQYKSLHNGVELGSHKVVYFLDNIYFGRGDW